jgi:Acetyltransferases
MEPLALVYGPVNEKILGQFRKINEATLAVSYSEKFYSAILASWQEFSFFAYLNDITIGSISARRETRNEENCVYVMTCSVLKPYRHLKIGTQLMQELFERSKKAGISAIFLHVWTASTDALQFYLALDFEKSEEIPDYYLELTPQSAFVLTKRVSN